MTADHLATPVPRHAFRQRHIGPSQEDVAAMLATLGFDTTAALAAATMPACIQTAEPLPLPPPCSESELAAVAQGLAAKNQLFRSYLGLGYHATVTPTVIKRNVLENPSWYTPYTPYQPEIAQGRLEALLGFQTMVVDLTGLPVANASLLDEATAAAEAMAMCHRALRGKRNGFFVADDCHPQTIEVVQTRAEAIGVEVVVGRPSGFDFAEHDVALCGALLQYPATDGSLVDYTECISRIQAAGALAVVATDLLALTLLKPPGEMGADIAIGSAQRFGVPLGFGGPHAAFLSARQKLLRQVPGRIVGVSRDVEGGVALRLALQTREQHIRRDKASSNICTAQVLLAVMAYMYAVYHGPTGLHRIALRVHRRARLLAAGLEALGYGVTESFFDTITVDGAAADAVCQRARERRINLRWYGDGRVGVSLDETVRVADIQDVLEVFSPGAPRPRQWDTVAGLEALLEDAPAAVPPELARQSSYLRHPNFNRYHSETEMMRYLRRLELRDLALDEAMIPLGSCTMKLSSAVEMEPVSLAGFGGLHPFVPSEQAQGYAALVDELVGMIRAVTGFEGVSLQPNAGSQGELAGLLVIRAYQRARGEAHRNVCLIPQSAHGTNPASAVMAGMRVVVVACDNDGNIDQADLEAKATAHQEQLSALMVTYPSTHGVFETSIREICATVHRRGGQVYLDGANLNAMVGLARPVDLGADVCHLNLHKTFSIPHGGGGPGMGPIAAAPHLASFLPGHPVVRTGGEQAIGAVAGAPWGSAGVLPISWAYIKLMGAEGLQRATQVAILNANYMAKRLEAHYPVVYRGNQGLVAHEFIIDLRPFKVSCDVSVDDVAKRLMDFGFHAPTMSWPVAGTMMVEPTESESKHELDRFCDAMIEIRQEIAAIERGELDRANNPLKQAPHTVAAVTATEWDRPYPREQGAFPEPRLRQHKFWPAVARVDNVYGDRNFVGTLAGLE